MIEPWGETRDGASVYRVTIASDQMTASLLSFGATLQDLRLAGFGHPLVLGFDHFEPYENSPKYFGAAVGRFANRVSNATAQIDGQWLHLDQNADPHHLHGGRNGSSFRNWRVADHGPNFVVFEDVLPDGHMGFPGNLRVSARYQMTGPSLMLTFNATTDAPTLCNFTGHSYFHLDETADLSDHFLTVIADSFTERTDEGIPTGKTCLTNGSKLDFNSSKPLVDNHGLRRIDENFCLSDQRGPLRHAATLTSKASKLTMDLATTESGLQAYTMEQIDPFPASGMKASTGIALEPQVWPDAPNHAGFPTATLRHGDLYRHQTTYTFSHA